MKHLGEFVKAILDNGGATYDLRGDHPTKGIVVSTPGHEENRAFPDTDKEQFALQTVIDYIGNHGALLDQDGYYLGGWIEKNALVLDVSEVFHKEETAVRQGVIRNQKAIFDLDRLEEIDLREVRGQNCGTETQKVSSKESKIRQIIRDLEKKRKDI